MSQQLKLRSAISSTVFERLNVLLEQTTVDQIELARLERDAHELKDKTLSFTLLGALAALKFNVSDVNKYYNAARACSHIDNYQDTEQNFSCSFQHIYQLTKAADIIFDLHNNFRDDLRLLNDATSMCTTALQFYKLKQLNERAFALNYNNHSSNNSKMRNSTEILKLLEKNGVSEKDLGDRVDAAAQVLLKNKIPFKGTNILPLANGEFMYRFYMDLSPEKSAKLNFEIADTLIEQFEDTLSHIFTISCTPYVNRVE